MDITQSKSILAKLMAGEKINVVHGNYPTASFDLKTRTIHLPIWKNMDGYMYDLLTGHEVGHALETPEQGWHDAICTNRKFKSFLNVVEDARIEKKVKRQYPGLSKSFAKAYSELHKRNFFGVNGLADMNALNLIDRINLYFKIGAYIHVPFNETEMKFVNEISNIETWEQVVDVATRVYDYVKTNESDKIQDMSDLNDTLYAQKEESEENDSDDSDDSDSENDFDMSGESYSFGDEESDEDSDDGEVFGDSDDSSEEDGEESDSDDSDSNSTESSDDEGSEEGGSSIDGGTSSEDDEQVSDEDDDGEPESVTDTAFRKRENELVNQTGEIAIVQLPSPILKNIVQKPDSIIESMTRLLRNRNWTVNAEAHANIIDYCVQKFTRKNAGYINLLSQQFEMRKNAAQYSRTRTSRTGVLDTNKLHQYRTSNSLFKSAEIVTKGKNHGMMMFIDMSGSMNNCIRNVIEQTLIMVAFCKRVRIPFEVYGFSDCPHDYPKNMDVSASKFTKPTNGNGYLDIRNASFHLKQFFTDTMPIDQYRKMFGLMCAVVDRKVELMLGGTPLCETIIASRTLIDNFRSRTNVENMNVIHLTDGEGSGCHYMNSKGESNNLYFCDNLGYPVFIIDPITQKRIDASSGYFQDSLTKFVADVTGSNMISFYITDSAHNYVNAMRSKDPNAFAVRDAIRKQFLDDNYGVIEDYRGYKNYMFVRILRQRKNTDEVIDTNVSNSKLAASILKGMRSSAANKTMATKFASMLTM